MGDITDLLDKKTLTLDEMVEVTKIAPSTFRRLFGDRDVITLGQLYHTGYETFVTREWKVMGERGNKYYVNTLYKD